MIKTTDILLDELREYGSPRSKLSRLAKSGKVFPIVKGLYETDPKTPGVYLAASIYGPSYVSFAYALSYYGMIPEISHVITNATYEKKKIKKYDTPFGTFTYRDVPSNAFPLGLRVVQEGDYYYRIATPEKALCDTLYTLPPVANVSELHILLAEDLRIDEAELGKLDSSIVLELSNHYHSTNVRKLCTLLRRMKNDQSN